MSAGTMTSLEQSFSDALSKATGQEPRRVGNEWKGLCPAHGDRSPSLDFHEENGKLLIVCRSRGCKRDDVFSVAGWNPPDTFARRPVRARFPYHDEKGNELAVKIRFDDTDEAGKKCMFDRKLGGKKLPLYRLPEVLAAMRDGRPVYVAEGEKDADTLRALGLAATSAPYGAVTGTNVSGKWLSSYTDTLAGADVVLLQDADEAGAEHVRNVVRLLAGRAESLRIVPPFPGPKGTDVTDWLGSTRVSRSGSTCHTRDELLALVEAAPEWKDAEPAPDPDAKTAPAENGETKDEFPIVSLTVGELLERAFPPRGQIIGPVLAEKSLAMIYAPRGTGKTWVSGTMAVAAASGSVVFPSPHEDRPAWGAPKSRRVVIFDGEMPAVVLKNRFAQIIAGGRYEPGDRLRIVADDIQSEGLPSLIRPEAQARMDDLIRDAELVIFDNVSTLFRGLDENDSQAWDSVQEWQIRLRREGRSVLLVHHAGKGGQQRGTSKREDVLDLVISLKRPADYVEEEGCRVEVHLEKARGITGSDVLPFEAKLTVSRGLATWETSPLADEELNAKIASMRESGMPTRKIAGLVGLDQSTVVRRLARADRRTKLAADARKKSDAHQTRISASGG